MKKTKWIWGIAVMALAVMLSVGCFTAFAAGDDAETDGPKTFEGTPVPENTGEEAGAEESVPENTATDAEIEEPTPEQSEYSYLTGQRRSANRNDLYAQAENLPEDERDAFLAENGIGETPYSEETAESYGYVAGRQRGASYRQSDDSERTQDVSGYNYLIGQERGASYHK